MPACNDREYRRFAGDVEIRAVVKPENGGKEEQTAVGYATTFNEEYELFRDRDGLDEYIFFESVDSHAFDKCDMSDVIMQYDHHGRVFARTQNNTLETVPDEKGLHVVAYLGGTEIGRQLLEEIRGGYSTKMSFGFVVSAQERTTEEETKEDGGKIIRIHRKITGFKKLFDVSVVSQPANDNTSISARSIGDVVINDVKKERLALMQREREDLKKRITILNELH